MSLDFHPLLTFWQVRPFGGVGTSWVIRKDEGSERCPACGSERSFKSLKDAKLHIAGRGSKWPDILNCTSLLLLHERVVQTLKAEGLAGFIAHPTEIAEIEIKNLAALPSGSAHGFPVRRCGGLGRRRGEFPITIPIGSRRRRRG